MLVKFFVLLLFAASPGLAQNVIGVNVYAGGKKYCDPPPQPAKGGTYSLKGVPHPTIRNAYSSFTLTYKCFAYYIMRDGDEVVQCKDGNWVNTIPECVHYQSLSSSYTPPQGRDNCEVPPHPRGGKYNVQGNPDAFPGAVFEFVQINVTCNYRFKPEGIETAFCIRGQWSGGGALPKCVHISSGCELRKHATVDYLCQQDGNDLGYCGNEVSSGVTVRLQCKPTHEDSNLWRVTTMSCVNGFWDNSAVCSPKLGNNTCPLFKHPAVEYRCSNPDGSFRVCDDEEPAGSIVRLRCRKKDIPIDSLSSAHLYCVDTNWNHVTECNPGVSQNSAECGIQSGNRPLVFGGKSAVRGELPWHVGVYTKTVSPYQLICGGTLIRNNLILSAAHCFWDDLEKQLPASEFAVAVGKLIREWNDERDIDAQQADVSEIIIPPLFQGNTANFQEDIALVRVASPFLFAKHVRPVCLDFDFDFEKKQLRKGSIGKVGGWGLTSGDSGQSPVLRTAEMPFVTYVDCIRGTSPSFAAYVTSDKICAGTNGTAVCKGDSGGGLTFRDTKNGITRFYLRGIVSTAPNSGEECDGTSWATFTSVNRQQHFIRDYL